MSDRGETDDPSRDERLDDASDEASDGRDVDGANDPIEGEPNDPIEGDLDAVPFETDGSEIVDPAAMVRNARRRHGALGGVLAAGMLGLDEALGRKVRQEAPVVVDANSDPVDLDTDGISIAVADDTDVVSPPLPRTPPITSTAKRRRR